MWKFGADGAVEDIKFKGQGCAISQASGVAHDRQAEGPQPSRKPAK
jgi:NifU-like protein involved in Fe-S cluster formation